MPCTKQYVRAYLFATIRLLLRIGKSIRIQQQLFKMCKVPIFYCTTVNACVYILSQQYSSRCIRLKFLLGCSCGCEFYSPIRTLRELKTSFKTKMLPNEKFSQHVLLIIVVQSEFELLMGRIYNLLLITINIYSYVCLCVKNSSQVVKFDISALNLPEVWFQSNLNRSYNPYLGSNLV